MKKIIGIAALLFAISSATFAQEKGEGSEKISVPSVVMEANMQKYPESKKYHVTWEKENGNYEANWGGKDGEANSVQYTPAGVFIEIVRAISVSELPVNITTYVKQHYSNAKINEAGKVTDAAGKTSYEVEIQGKDVLFDANGNFIKAE